jgi:hypothetical protein
MLKIEVVLDAEQIKEAFENVEVKATKKKIFDLLEMTDNAELDIKEALEERLIEFLEELITDEWER